MVVKRVTAFCITVFLTLILIAFTMSDIVAQVRLGLDLKGGFEILYEAAAVEGGNEVTLDNLRQTAKSLEKRVNALGTAEPEIWTEGTNRIRVRLAGVDNEAKVRELLKKPAELTVTGPNHSVELIGTDFIEGAAKVVYDDMRKPNIQVEVKDKARLEEISTRLLNQKISFNLDDKILTDPVVLAVMTNGLLRITGNFTFDDAHELADIINMGALPLQLTEKFNQSVGASLGKQSLHQTLQAGAVGSVLIFLFMLIFYRIPGLVASLTLITYSWLLLLCFNLLQATMTLPGIAAFVLGIGMAVDANIITYERLKEELRTGKSLLSSLKAGSKHSFRTIMDANVTTLIAGFVLFSLGSGSIKGFAITLILSIGLSILTNVYFSQWLLRMLISSNLFRDIRWFGVKPEQRTNRSEAVELPTLHRSFDFVSRTKMFFWTSMIVTILGVISLLYQNMNYGVDFKAGTALDIILPDPVSQEEAEALIHRAGYEPSILTVGGSNQDHVSMRFDEVLNPDGQDSSRIISSFSSVFGEKIGKEENTVDPEIAREFAGKAAFAVLLSSLGILLYLCFRFEWRFAMGAIIALLHDVFFVISVFSFFQLEVNLPFIAAMLTIIGYSINDTVVIFDRIRENMRFTRASTAEDLTRIVNISINQTLTRSVNTIVCVLFACIAILIWGSESIRLFSLAMTIGLLVGMYSSIYIASQIWLVLKKRALRRQNVSNNSGETQYYMTPLQTNYDDN
ncbi:protein translocase subunit SecD [Paenibacillus luteus]|uniref:protein translocase subunit SecD n=1 Tax=Paenibacillus luteus TaxID=2545753 RepID=UPI0011432A9E|nr:protein translocase subunit SecD [Paenibacillus luteus]